VEPAGAVGVLAIVDFAPGSRWTGVRNLMFGRWPLSRADGIRFRKVLGSGHEGGFGLKPSVSHQGMFAVFDDDAAADAWLERSEQLARYRALGASWLTLKLRAYASRGAWDGVAPLSVSVEKPPHGVIASLTRGSIKPSKASAFWSHAPAAQEAITRSEACLLSIGLGEAPVFRQCTFTLWRSEAELEAWSATTAHRTSAQAALHGGHFSESLFTRFVPYAARGAWKGTPAASFGLRESVAS
jgi:spheroidene monooxygenase